MRDFLAEYCKKNEKKINPDLFNRTFDKPLVDYIVDTFKNLEVLPAVKLKSWEYITDQTQIHTYVNKRNKRDVKIKNNKILERLYTMDDSIYDLLVLHFELKVKGQRADIVRRVWVPKVVDGHYYLRSGKKVLPLIQIVDNSTFVKQGNKKEDNVLNFKTTLYPIKIYAIPTKISILDHAKDVIWKIPLFQVDLFTKPTNPLLYFLAEYGIESTLEMFNLEELVAITHDVLDPDRYMYTKINNHVYIEVNRKAFFAHEFISRFVVTLHNALAEDKQKLTLQDVFDRDYWLGRLSEVFSKKRNPNKGERVLISFKKVMDPYTKKRLPLKKYQKKNTFTVMKWMLTNFEDLLKKDSNDLATKRMRANETQAFFIDSYVTKNVNSLLNTDDPSFDRYMRLFNAISEDIVLRSSHSSGGKSSQTSMFRFERYNDFTALELSRFTLKGPTGLNGGKKKTNLKYRDIYPSHLGRFDPNVCSSSDPGLTGYLCINVQFDENGYFDSKSGKSEPNGYEDSIDKVIEKYAEPGYAQKRADIKQNELNRDADGFIVLHRRKSQKEMTEEFNKNPWKYGLYDAGDYLLLQPRFEGQRDPKGFMMLQPRRKERHKLFETEPLRDSEGFLVLTKLEKGKKK